ncbi:hypothetical protein [Duncaniella muris]|uniref:hypothetical protein n=1 Tax=Duncaniella muris TaxID=2094150 RepID=UPI003F677384
MASVTGYTTNKDADGRVTVNSIAANGEVVTSRTFKNEQEAKQETDNIMRQAELNSLTLVNDTRKPLPMTWCLMPLSARCRRRRPCNNQEDISCGQGRE